MSSENDGTGREHYAKYALIGIVALVAIGVIYHYWSRPPQMGTSEEVFNTVDALYTAVRNQDDKRMGECEARLKGYREAGKLPESAANALPEPAFAAHFLPQRLEQSIAKLHGLIDEERQHHQHREDDG